MSKKKYSLISRGSRSKRNEKSKGKGVVKKTPMLLGFIYFYQKKISPKFFSRCIYRPTCSEYMAESIRRFGTAKGFLLGAKRLLRCNQFHEGGVDEVPENFLDGFKIIRLFKRSKKI